MINNIKIQISNGDNIKLCDKNINPLMDEYVNKLWNKYYLLFNKSCIKINYFICGKPYDFINETNKFYFVNNKICTKNRAKTKHRPKFKERKLLVNLKKSNYYFISRKRLYHKYVNIDNIKVLTKYKFTNNSFIMYNYILNKYNLIKNNIKCLSLIENNNCFGNIESLLYNKKKLNINIDIIYIQKFRYSKRLKNRQIYIKQQLKKYIKLSDKYIKYDGCFDFDLLNSIENKYDLILLSLKNWRSLSLEFMEYADYNIYFFNFLLGLTKLKINGSLITSMSLNTTFSCDIILLAKEYFEDIIFDTNNSLNFMDEEHYKYMIVFKKLKQKIKKEDLDKLNKIFEKLLLLNKTSLSFNIKNIKLRNKYNIIKDVSICKSFSFIKSILNLKKNNYDFFRKLNNDFYEKKNIILDNTIKLLNKNYNIKVPLEYRMYQFNESLKYLKNNNLEYHNEDKIIKEINKNFNYPKLKYAIDIIENIQKLEKYKPLFKINNKNEIDIKNDIKNNINKYNIGDIYSFNNKIYKFWYNNKDKINNFFLKHTLNTDLEKLNKVYNLYYKKKIIYFENVMMALIYRYNPINILDVHFTTLKNLTASIIKYTNYTILYKYIKDYDYLLSVYSKIKYLNDKEYKYNFIYKYPKNKKYDLIFIDTEYKFYKKQNISKYFKILSDSGVLVYSYYEEIKDNINKKYKYEIINYYKQKLLIYFKQKNEITKWTVNDYSNYNDTNDINKIFKNIKEYKPIFIFNINPNEIDLVYSSTVTYNTRINYMNYTSLFDEEIYIDFWNKNKDSIIKFCNTTYNEISQENISNAVYNVYNNTNMLYFETIILALINRYNSNNILDVFYTTDKRIVGSLIQNKDYTLITDNTEIKNRIKNTYIKKLNKINKYKFIKSLNKTKDRYDLIFIDTESKEYKTPNLEKYLNHSTKEIGVIVYSYYKTIKDKINKNYKYEIISFNNQKLLIYFNKNTNKEKTYIVMSPYIQNPQIYFNNNWKQMNEYTDYVDFIFIELQYKKYKNLYNINSTYKSLLNINPVFNFTNKLELFNYVKDNNNKMYKQYFMENYEIKNNEESFKQINKLFKKHKYWIVKPTVGASGFGVKIFNNSDNLIKYISTFNKKYSYKESKWVIQQYIDNPLLIKKYNKKFHFRVNILITLINNKIELYIFNHYSFYLAGKEFTLKKLTKNIHDTHLKSTKKKESGTYPEYFIKMYGTKNRKEVDNQIRKLFSYIKTQIKVSCFKESKNCFKFYGADIMVTDNFNIKILEINDNPGNSFFEMFPKYKNDFYKGMFDIIINNKISKHYYKC